MEQKKNDIFISYSRKDLEKVKAIKSVIEHETGADCWRDLEDISTDEEDYLDKIVEGIENCKVFIFMLSKYSQESEHAIGELLAAKKQSKKTGLHVVIVNIDNCEMNMKFTVRFSVKNMIFWKDQPQRDKLLRDIMKWTGRKLPEPVPNPNPEEDELSDTASCLIMLISLTIGIAVGIWSDMRWLGCVTFFVIWFLSYLLVGMFRKRK